MGLERITSSSLGVCFTRCATNTETINVLQMPRSLFQLSITCRVANHKCCKNAKISFHSSREKRFFSKSSFVSEAKTKMSQLIGAIFRRFFVFPLNLTVRFFFPTMEQLALSVFRLHILALKCNKRPHWLGVTAQLLYE